MSFQSQLKAYADQVDLRLDSVLPSLQTEPALLHEAMRYSALAPGKRLRPALVLACCEAVGGTIAQGIDGACSVELVHCFSLIHDDLPALDNDALRRGLPTCHVKYGEAVAILAGDGLFALAFDMLAGSSAPADRVVAAVRVLTKATANLVDGETLDILSEGQVVSYETLRTIHALKTGALISASCSIGALLGGGDDDVVDAFDRYGAEMGLAFQIADDVLNETSTAEQLGKAAGSDRDRGKVTYPSLFGLDKSRKMAIEAADRAVAELPVSSEFLETVARFSVERVK